MKTAKNKTSLSNRYFQLSGRAKLRGLLALIIVTGIGFALIVYGFSRELPSLEELERFEPNLISRIYASDGTVLREILNEKRLLVTLEQCPPHLIQTIIASEDHLFWDHWGVNMVRFFGALKVDLLTLSKQQGFSTITMQLARGLHFGPEKEFTRKIKEVFTAILIEKTYAKSEILEMYLNNAYFGQNIFGVRAAAQLYFGKEVLELTLAESALLVSQLPAPARLSLIKHPDRALARRNLILQNMRSKGLISSQDYSTAVNMPITLKDKSQEVQGIARYFTEYVRLKVEEMQDQWGVDIRTDGLSIYTSLNPTLQTIAEKAVRDKLAEHQKRLGGKIQQLVANHVQLTPTDTLVQSAFVAVEISTGKILVLVGGKDFFASQFNRATQAKRQPGSAFKPFVYSAAIHNGYKASDSLLNQDIVLQMWDGSLWSPQNYDRSRSGMVTMREGFVRSLNLISVRILQQLIIPEEAIRFAVSMGITTNLRPVDALALGVSEVIPLEIVGAYSVFPNGGIWVEPHAILKIEDRFGNTIFSANPQKREVLNEETAYIMTNLLQSVISGGTGASVRSVYGFKRPAGGKTGTTQEYTDAWFIGFTPQICAGVWVGLDNPQMTLGARQAGAVAALPIWANFMKAAYDSLPILELDFVRPLGVVELNICTDTRKIATYLCPRTIKEVFDIRNQPDISCPNHQ